MRKTDQFHKFIQEAIVSANKSPNYYYFFNKKERKLVRKRCEDLSKIDEGYIELPKVSFQEKLTYLNQFLDENKDYKNELSKLMNKFTEYSEFQWEKDLNIVNSDLAMKFYFNSSSFLYQSIQKHYNHFNLNEDLKIEW